VKLDQEILDSFKLQTTLCPTVWDLEENPQQLKNEVKLNLIKVSELFRDFIGVDFFVDDVIMTGSLANYNWSKFSDVDLHLVVDFTQFDEDKLELYIELFKVKKTIFNNVHNIKIYGFDVEVYVQDSNESHFSSGVYSVLYDEWIVKPKHEKIDVDKKILKDKINQWVNIIDGVKETTEDISAEESKEIIDKYRDKLKKFRSCGLEKGGEFSYENIVFKYLRRSGHIEKLFNLENQILDKELSLSKK
jgi:predicted nucleotidyltransferase